MNTFQTLVIIVFGMVPEVLIVVTICSRIKNWRNL